MNDISSTANSSDQASVEPPVFASPWAALYFAWRNNGMQRAADTEEEETPANVN